VNMKGDEPPSTEKRLRWVYEPPVLRFFLGRLEDIDSWGEKLVGVYKKELGDL